MCDVLWLSSSSPLANRIMTVFLYRLVSVFYSRLSVFGVSQRTFCTIIPSSHLDCANITPMFQVRLSPTRLPRPVKVVGVNLK